MAASLWKTIELASGAGPEAGGEKLTVKDSDWPGVKTMFGGMGGKPAMLKPGPGGVKELMVTGVPPAFVSVTAVGALVVPATVLPNVMLEGFAISEPAAAGVPFPDSFRIAGESRAVLTIERLAVTPGIAVGEKLTLN